MRLAASVTQIGFFSSLNSCGCRHFRQPHFTGGSRIPRRGVFMLDAFGSTSTHPIEGDTLVQSMPGKNIRSLYVVALLTAPFSCERASRRTTWRPEPDPERRFADTFFEFPPRRSPIELLSGIPRQKRGGADPQHCAALSGHCLVGSLQSTTQVNLLLCFLPAYPRSAQAHFRNRWLGPAPSPGTLTGSFAMASPIPAIGRRQAFAATRRRRRPACPLCRGVKLEGNADAKHAKLSFRACNHQTAHDHPDRSTRP